MRSWVKQADVDEGVRTGVTLSQAERVRDLAEARDYERFLIDKSTYTIRRAFREIGRRLLERGQLNEDRDVWFLTQDDLFDVTFDRVRGPAIVQAKIDGRKRKLRPL